MDETSAEMVADVVVVGSGGSGLSAAIAARHYGADVLLLERSDRFGGTTAVSGGVVWIPNNDRIGEVGSTDSEERALSYMRTLSLGKMEEDLIQTYVAQAKNVVRFIEENSDLRFRPLSFPDYHADFSGGNVGRSMSVGLFPAAKLGAKREFLRASAHYPFPISALDMEDGVNLIDPEVIAPRMAEDMVGMGAAIVAGLLHAAMNKGVQLQHSTRARKLIREDGRIVGLEAEHEGATIRIRARRGVILASGGFEWNEDLTRQFLRGPLERSSTPPQNTGDGLLMAMEVGASLGNMGEAWWQPGIDIPGEEYDGQRLTRTTGGERSLPGSIMVNRQGKRFANEAVNYNDLGRTFHAFNPQTFEYSNIPAWVILHQGFLDKFPFGTIFPGDPIPSWLVSAPTLGELAQKVGIDPVGLEETVARYNEHAREGRDPDFNRGTTPLEQYKGPQVPPSPFNTLAPLEKAPFYAVRIHSSTIGTKGGPRTNTQAQVLDTRGEPIPGLYAAGNVSAAVMGMGYPGGGATIGQAITFGHIAGRVAAGSN